MQLAAIQHCASLKKEKSFCIFLFYSRLLSGIDKLARMVNDTSMS